MNSETVNSEQEDALRYAKRFQDLLVYRKARTLSRDVFAASLSFPKEEGYALTDQFRRASRSVGAQIAEAWAKRRYERHFVSKLTDADAEQMETQHWITVAYDCGYVSKEQANRLGGSCLEIGRMLGRMIQASASFCQQGGALMEDSAVYYATEPDLITDH